MKVKIITNMAPKYRAPLWKKLLASGLDSYEFSFDCYARDGIEQIDFSEKFFTKYKSQFKYIDNFYINGRWLIWQKGVISQCAFDKFDRVIFLAEASCLSTWIASIICRFRRKKVIFWGHGLYGNENFFKLKLRNFFYMLADRFLVYEERAKSLMIDCGFNSKDIFVVFNSLDYDLHKKFRNIFKFFPRSEVFPFFRNSSLPVIVFVGRTTKEKKLNLLVDAISLLNNRDCKYNLLVIGGGSEFDSLQKSAESGIEGEYMHFAGPIYDENLTGKYLACSDLCVSPGNVGLTAIHSLSLGTPVATHGKMENQMPESASISDWYNGFYFEKDDINSLIRSIDRWFVENSDRNLVRERCYEVIDTFYNPNNQFKVFKEVIN